MPAVGTDVTVTLRLIDGLTGPGKKAAESLRSILKAANDLKKVSLGDKLTGDLKASQAQIRGMTADIRNFSSSFRGAMDAARGMSKEIGGKSGGMFAADVRNLKEMVRLQGQLGRGGAGIGRRGALGLMGYGYGHPHLRSGARKAYMATTNLDTETHLLTAAGFGGADRDLFLKAAADAAAAVPVSTQAQNLHRLRELNYALGNRPQMAAQILPDVAKLMAVVQFAKGEDAAKTASDQIMEAIKGAELKNLITDIPTLQRWLKFQGQSVLATGGLVQPGSLFQTFKYARSAVHGWKEDFFPIVSELTQELMTGKGGGRGGAGPSLANFKKYFVDNSIAGQNVPELLRRGLIDPKYAHKTRNGWKLDPGMAFYDNKLAAENPFEFMKKNILPAMARDKVDLKDHAAVVKWIAAMGGTDVFKQMLAIMVIQREQLEHRLELYKQVPGIDETYIESMRTLAMNTKALSKQTEDMSASLFAPMAPLANQILGGMTSLATSISQWAKRNGSLIQTMGPAMLLSGGGLAAFLLRTVLGRTGGALVGDGLGMMLGGGPGALLGGMLGGGLSSGAGALGAILGPASLFAGMLGLAKLSQGIDIGKFFDGLGVSAWTKKFGDDLIAGLADLPNRIISHFSGLASSVMAAFDAGGFAGVGAMIMNSLLSGLQADAEKIKSWATSFVEWLKALFNFTAGPTIVPKVAPGAIGDPGGSGFRYENYIAPGGGGGGEQRAGGGQVVNIAAVNLGGVVVHGATDPRAVVQAVQDHFRGAIGRHLSDGAYA